MTEREIREEVKLQCINALRALTNLNLPPDHSEYSRVINIGIRTIRTEVDTTPIKTEG